MISQILALARLAEDVPATEDVVDLATVVEDVARDADYEARGKNRRVELVVEARPEIRGIDHALRSAIENVVRNAVAFTAEATSVTIALSLSGDEAIVRVRDHGPGVPEDVLTAIFHPFYRVGTDRDRRTGGTGLGLAIAARIVKRHAGRVVARNLAAGGLEMEITLPVGPARGERSANR
jgi:signal transduction histidine kinase